MKISPGMAEAGVNAMARAKRQPTGDSALVAMIFSAMDMVRRQEESRQRISDKPKAYEHQSWPAWRYSPAGEGKIFAKAEDVPEGWTESVQVHVLARDAEVLSGKRGPGRPPKARAA